MLPSLTLLRSTNPAARVPAERREAIQAGIVTAASIDAAARILDLDQEHIEALKDGINAVVGAGLGAGMTPGAVVAPVANLAVSKAVDYACTERDFTGAANMLRGSLEGIKLNQADVDEVFNPSAGSSAKATRYFQWLNTAIHCMGRS